MALVLTQNLWVPGPTALPPEAVAAMTQAVFDHRSSEFHLLYKQLQGSLQHAQGIEDPCLFVVGGGTAAMEAAVLNFSDPGDTVAVIVNGCFALRFVELAKRHDRQVKVFTQQVGTPFLTEDLATLLKRCGTERAVFVVVNETCSGMRNDLGLIAGLVHALNPRRS